VLADGGTPAGLVADRSPGRRDRTFRVRRRAEDAVLGEPVRTGLSAAHASGSRLLVRSSPSSAVAVQQQRWFSHPFEEEVR
jgi:hypothetical protein